jgi:parallel beta-helix repeat protein
VENNEIAYNNTAGFSPARWEAGATKFAATDGLIVRGNFIHHNHGSGLWSDVNAINTLYENNRVEDNDWRGLLYEISYKGIIRNNSFRRNGFVLPLTYAFSVDGAAIVISNSRDVEIYGNTIENNKNGIGFIQTNRGTGPYGAHLVYNVYVHDNSIVQPTGRAAGAVQNVGTNAVFTSQNNRFVHGTYDLGTAAKYFTWMNADRTTTEWKGYGLDMTGTFK